MEGPQLKQPSMLLKEMEGLKRHAVAFVPGALGENSQNERVLVHLCVGAPQRLPSNYLQDQCF